MELASTVRAKVRCSGIKNTEGSFKGKPTIMSTLEFYFVYANGDPNHENSKFWEYSPGGKIEMNTVNPEAVKALQIGKEYYIDFIPAS